MATRINHDIILVTTAEIHQWLYWFDKDPQNCFIRDDIRIIRINDDARVYQIISNVFVVSNALLTSLAQYIVLTW